MKITCSILCYNYGHYLSQAIESCLNQQPGDYELEVLVIDDGSTDETPEICQNYHSSIRVLRSQNQGFGASLDKAIREASGDYVCLLDADDYFASDKIVTILPWIQKEYLYIQNQNYFINRDGKAIDSLIRAGGCTSTLCLKRATALTLLPVQNEIFFHPINSAGHGIELNEALTFYRIHQTNMSNNKIAGVWQQHLAEVIHNLADKLILMKLNPCDWADFYALEKISREYRAIAYYKEMEAALERGERRKAFLACLGIFIAAIRSRTGLKTWHFKVIFRGIFLGRAISNHLKYL